MYMVDMVSPVRDLKTPIPFQGQRRDCTTRVHDASLRNQTRSFFFYNVAWISSLNFLITQRLCSEGVSTICLMTEIKQNILKRKNPTKEGADKRKAVTTKLSREQAPPLV